MNDLLARLTGLVLLDPGWLLLALAVPLALLLRWRGGRPAVLFAPGALLGPEAPAAGGEGAARTLARLPRTWRVRLLPLPAVLEALGLLLLVLALARPAHPGEVPVEVPGIDILLCLDTSSSMTATDMDPERTRLEVAREAAADFVRARPSDRIGLLVFARYPDLLCPLTRDHRALAEILDQVRPVAGDGPEDATGLGAAVAEAARVLPRDGPRSSVVVLLTDGEENVALTGAGGEVAPVHAAQLCERLGVRVYAIVAGVGRRDASGAFVKQDTRAVEDLAARTGGAFLEARDAGALARMYARIDELERAPAPGFRRVHEDRFLAFLLAGLILVLLGRLLGATALDVLP